MSECTELPFLMATSPVPPGSEGSAAARKTRPKPPSPTLESRFQLAVAVRSSSSEIAGAA